MHAVVGKVAAQPFDPLEVRRKPVLHDKVFAKAQDICGIKQRLFFGGDKELLGRPLQPLCVADFVAQIIGMIICVCQAWFGCAFMPEIRVFIEILLHQGAVVQVFKPAAAI